MRLNQGETALWQSSAASLIEPSVGMPLRNFGYSGFSLVTVRLPRGAATPPPRDRGFAVVTDQRVIFRGNTVNLVWEYRELVGYAHAPNAPITLMHVRNRQRISGLILPASEAPYFRFHFTLGLSMADGRRGGFVAHLEGLLDGLRQRYPTRPPPALPEQAPYGFLRTVYTGRPSMPGWLRLAQGIAAGAGSALAVLFLVGLWAPGVPTSSVTGDSSGTPVVTTSTTAPTTARSPRASVPRTAVAPTTTPSTTTVSPKAPERTATSPVIPKRTVTRTPEPRPEPKPTPSQSRRPSRTPEPEPAPEPEPDPVDLCGAPENPYGYNFCGGSRIYDPEPETCSYFDCIGYFDEGKGFMIQCRDGDYSLSGGRPGACSHHGGRGRTVYE
ncbi:MAG: DUF3761 domain-containing protein [Streptosporangiales bacterium]|nr:DUF3761 domain-containing protein [Streptosporangiales bacterium]